METNHHLRVLIRTKKIPLKPYPDDIQRRETEIANIKRFNRFAQSGIFLPGMKIKINNTPYHFEKEKSIEEILTDLNISRDHGIAVALNYTVVAKDRFSLTFPKDGDSLEIIHATAGG